jgi:hypothetical protein
VIRLAIYLGADEIASSAWLMAKPSNPSAVSERVPLRARHHVTEGWISRRRAREVMQWSSTTRCGSTRRPTHGAETVRSVDVEQWTVGLDGQAMEMRRINFPDGRNWIYALMKKYWRRVRAPSFLLVIAPAR